MAAEMDASTEALTQSGLIADILWIVQYVHSY